MLDALLRHAFGITHRRISPLRHTWHITGKLWRGPFVVHHRLDDGNDNNNTAPLPVLAGIRELLTAVALVLTHHRLQPGDRITMDVEVDDTNV